MTDDNSPAIMFGFDLDASVDANGLSISPALSASLTASLLGLTVTVNDIELALELHVRPGADPVVSLSADVTGPTGGSATVNLPAISGHGDLVNDPMHETWSGALMLQLSSLSVDAFAVISPGPAFAVISPGPAFVVVLCARFPQPGIQVGFGFAVSGVGGVFGLNRRSDPDALTAAILDGSLSGLLFPHDAQDDEQRIVANLPALFPDAPGQLIVGPMLEITWAAGLLAAEILLLVELPNPLRVSVIGQLTVDLPADDAAIVHIEARVAAIITPGIPEFRLIASLTGSTIAGFPLTGDMFLLIRGGPEATFVFSAGGFHPAAIPPPNVPPMKRLGMVMGLSFIELRCESYLAVTTASVQLGALVELNAHVAGCRINAHLGFDALIEWKPQFYLRVDVHAGLSVEIAGEHLCGVSFDGYLEGPGPFHLHGRAEVELLFISVPIPIDATFGSGAKAIDPSPDVGKILIDALSVPSAWTIHPPAASDDGVVFSPAAQAAIAAGTVLHPSGGLRVVQHAVPLEMVIDRFGGQSVPDQRWAITGVAIDDKPDPLQPGWPEAVSDTFADGTFRTLAVDEQLSNSGFTDHHAGAEIRPTGLVAAPKGPPCPINPRDTVNGPLLTVVGPIALFPGVFETVGQMPLRRAAITLTAPGAPVSVASEPATVLITDPSIDTSTVYATRSAALDQVRILAAAGQTAQILEKWENS